MPSAGRLRFSSTDRVRAILLATAVVIATLALLGGTARAAGPSYSSVIESDSPSGYWRLDELSGACSPSPAAGTTGSLTATSACSSTSGALSDPADTADGAQSLAGGYFTAANGSADSFTGAFTLEAWINTDSTSQQGIIEKYDDPSGSNGYGIRLNSSNHLFGFVCNATASGSCSGVTSSTALATNTWYLVDFVATGSTETIYVDGTAVASTGQTQSPTAGSATLKVGASGDADVDHTDPTHSFQGDLDEVAIYPGALSNARIAAHYGAGQSAYAKAVETDSPTGYWRLDEPSGACSPAASAGTAGSLTSTDSCSSTSGALNDPVDASDGAQALSGGYFTAPNSTADDLTGAFTLEAWINTNSVGEQGIIEKYDDPSGSDGYGVRLDSSNHLLGFVCNATARSDCSEVTTSTALAKNTWYLVDFVATGSTETIYVNGTAAASATQTQQPTAGTATLKVGAHGDADVDHVDPIDSFQGDLDEVAIYSSALPSARVAAHYAAAQPSYASTVESDSPSAFWPLNEPSGSCTPASAVGSVGPLTPTASCLSTTGALTDPEDIGNAAQALSGGYFTAPSSTGNAFTAAFTLEAWINTNTVAQQGIIEKYDDPSGSNGYGIRLDSSNHLLGFVCNASALGACSTVTTSTALTTNTWYLVDFVASGSTETIYVNGTAVASATQTQSPTAGGATLKIGARGDADVDHVDPTNSFRGDLDEVAIYPSALSSTRVAAHYQAGT